MGLLLLQPRQGLRLRARHGRRQPRGAETRGLHGPGRQHHGPAHRQGEEPHRRLQQQEEQLEEPGPGFETGAGEDLQQGEHQHRGGSFSVWDIQQQWRRCWPLRWQHRLQLQPLWWQFILYFGRRRLVWRKSTEFGWKSVRWRRIQYKWFGIIWRRIINVIGRIVLL